LFVRAAAFLVLLAATVLAADPRPFIVGVLRRDGVVIPFAAFDGKHWQPAWSDPKLDVEVPIDLRNVPKKWWGPAGPFDTWQALTDAATAVTLRVRQPDVVAAHCLRQIGLRTDYRARQQPPPLDERPYPKDGLAIAPPQPVDRIDVLGARSREWTELLPVVADAFNKRERAFTPHPVSALKRDEREAIAPTIEALYAYGVEPRVLVVEAAREYWSEPKINECLGMAFGRIWLARVNGVFKPLHTTVQIDSCDREAVRYMLPLGVVAAGGRVFWIAQLSGWDSEYYEVVDLNDKEFTPVVTRLGGVCRQTE
jgi:hypothetical protein